MPAYLSPNEGFTATPQAWTDVIEARGEGIELAEVQILAPCLPQTLLCVGTNYADHAAESGVVPPEYPIIFAKLASAVVGPGEPIVIPLDEPSTDYEAELALVIGSTVRRANGPDAVSAIGGITAFNDVSGRRAQLVTGMGQYTRGKSYDTFGPLGPFVVHPEDLDLGDLPIQCRVSGEIRQSASTAEMVFSPQTLVEWISAAITLHPGDVIATGTPGGVGHSMRPPRYLAVGDTVRVELGGVGILENPVVAEQALVKWDGQQ